MSDESEDLRATLQAEFDSNQARLAEIDKYNQGLFESKVRGEIDDDLFGNLRRNYDIEKATLQSKQGELIEKIGTRNE